MGCALQFSLRCGGFLVRPLCCKKYLRVVHCCLFVYLMQWVTETQRSNHEGIRDHYTYLAFVQLLFCGEWGPNTTEEKL